MRRALGLAVAARRAAHPNPWVGAVIVTPSGEVHEGATEAPGGRHAERVALDAAGAPQAKGATLVATPRAVRRLRRQAHRRRAPKRSSPPASPGSSCRCPTPTSGSAGRGSLRSARPGVEVEVGRCRPTRLAALLAPYVHHRTHRPPVRRAEARGQPRRPHRRARRLQPMDHRRGGPTRCARTAGRERRSAGRSRHRARRRPRPHRAPRRGS